MWNWLNGKKTVLGICILAIGHALEKAGKLPTGAVDTVVMLAGTVITAIGGAHKVDKLTAAVASKAAPATGGGGPGNAP
jgi:hypothetical protein